MLVNMKYKPRILHSACASLQTGCKNAETSRKSAKTPCTDETPDLYSTQKRNTPPVSPDIINKCCQ